MTQPSWEVYGTWQYWLCLHKPSWRIQSQQAADRDKRNMDQHVSPSHCPSGRLLTCCPPVAPTAQACPASPNPAGQTAWAHSWTADTGLTMLTIPDALSPLPFHTVNVGSSATCLFTASPCYHSDLSCCTFPFHLVLLFVSVCVFQMSDLWVCFLPLMVQYYYLFSITLQLWLWNGFHFKPPQCSHHDLSQFLTLNTKWFFCLDYYSSKTHADT